MKLDIPFEPIVNYLFHILDSDPKDFSRHPHETWSSLYQLSLEETIAHYFVAWSLENWKEYFPEHRQKEIHDYLLRNQSRNIVLQSEIVYLAQLFNNAEIPIIFLKGSAGLIRGLYPLSLRYISDIDILVPIEQIKPSRTLLVSNGFIQTHSMSSFRRHHHIEPYNNPELPGEVELHVSPYDLSRLSSSEMRDIWDNAEGMLFKREEVTIPTITDHVWILMRTDILERAFLPRLRDIIEIFQIQQQGYSIDFQLISKRASNDNISNAVQGMSYACSKYMGLQPFIPGIDSGLIKWEEWTLNHKRKIISSQSKDDLFAVYYAGIRFLPSGIRFRSQLITWLLLHHYRHCFFIVSRKLLLITGLLKPAKKIKGLLHYRFRRGKING